MELLCSSRSGERVESMYAILGESTLNSMLWWAFNLVKSPSMIEPEGLWSSLARCMMSKLDWALFIIG
jgi:hypothetical protein